MALVLNGKIIATETEEKLKVEVEELKTKLGFTPALATILVGNDMASVTYVNMKAKACERVGLRSQIIRLPEETTTEELLKVIDDLNSDNEVCGILLQHPVPRQIDERACFDRISLEKDVDGVNSSSFGKMTMGLDAYVSATPLGIIRLLKEYDIELTGKHAVVVGRSAILGKPVAQLLLNENCTVTICHSRTNNLPEVIKTADIVIGAVGKPKFIQKDWLKDGVVLVDAGYNAGNVGDIDLENCIEKAIAYTPVPGGVGPMTINSLIYQAVDSAEKMCK
jgi:methylenetetrahydrofolate dehydrogenase (NADP+)/methenyltetrahydrofolate cyclohydrolase